MIDAARSKALIAIAQNDGPFFLWYLPVREGEWGDLAVAKEAPAEGWMLGRPDRLSLWSAHETLYQWIKAASDSLPILGADGQ